MPCRYQERCDEGDGLLRSPAAGKITADNAVHKGILGSRCCGYGSMSRG